MNGSGSTAQDWFPGRRPAIERDLKPSVVIAIDTEEDFDWDRPVEGTPRSTAHLHRLGTVQSIFAAYGAIPAYLVTQEVMRDPDAIASLRREFERGRCSLGLHLHPWVTPPLLGRSDPRDSFAGGLPGDFEARKLETLARTFRDTFGFAATTYRAGRYGFGPRTAGLLEAHGITIDVSVAPRADFSAQGGPDFAAFEYEPFWFGRGILELPLCRSVVGLAGRFGACLLERVGRAPGGGRVAGLVARGRLAERITLTPEGVDLPAMRRLVRGLRVRGRRIFAVSFHSSSITVGHNQYVSDKAGMHRFYDRLSGLLSHLADDVGAEFLALEAAPSRFETAS